jgi:oligoribonuclease NrnB/cAMP/cGMP phosphodiesterase (DHH superfamily)
METTKLIPSLDLTPPTLCFYHSADLDGHCSGALVKIAYPSCKMIPYDYGWEFPWKKYSWNSEVVWMVDISLPWNDMETLASMCGEFHWIDHHATSIKAAEESIANGQFNGEGIFSDGVAACELTWNYIYPDIRALPIFIYLIGKFDVWDHKANELIIPFHYGMQQYETDPTKWDKSEKIWRSLMNEENLYHISSVQKIIKDGSAIQAFEDIRNNKLAMSSAFAVELEGLRCLAINAPNTSEIKTGSKVFDSIINKDNFDAMLVFSFIGPEMKWKISLYSIREEVDVSSIAKKMGGGGHKNAAAWKSNKLDISLVSLPSITLLN